MRCAQLNVVCAMAAAGLVACGGGGTADVQSQPTALVSATPAAGPAGPTGRTASIVAPSHGAADAVSEPRAGADPLVLHRLGEELEQVEAILRRSADQQEALEVTRDARLELQKQAPNRLKIRGLVGVLAQAITQVNGLTKSAALLGRLAPMV